MKHSCLAATSRSSGGILLAMNASKNETETHPRRHFQAILELLPLATLPRSVICSEGPRTDGATLHRFVAYQSSLHWQTAGLGSVRDRRLQMHSILPPHTGRTENPNNRAQQKAQQFSHLPTGVRATLSVQSRTRRDEGWPTAQLRPGNVSKSSQSRIH